MLGPRTRRGTARPCFGLGDAEGIAVEVLGAGVHAHAPNFGRRLVDEHFRWNHQAAPGLAHKGRPQAVAQSSRSDAKRP